MKTQQLVPLAIGLVVAGLLALAFNSARNRDVTEVGHSSDRNRVLPGFPVNEIASVSFLNTTGSLHLEKKEGTWVVAERGGYPADFSKLGEFLKTVYDLPITQNVQVGASKFGRVGLLDPADKSSPADQTATIVSFKDGKGTEAASLWVGKEYKKEERSQFGTFDSTAGRYVLRAGSKDVYLVAEEMRDVKIEAKDWLDKSFFKVSKIKSISRTVSDPTKSWKLIRESDTADFTLLDAKSGEVIDPVKVGSMKTAFTSPSFEDILTGDKVSQPSDVAFHVETFDGFQYDVKIGPKNEAGEYDLTVVANGEFQATRKAPEGEKEEDKKAADEEFTKHLNELKKQLASEKKLAGHVYHVRGFVVDSINKDRAELMKTAESGATGGAGESPSGLPGIKTLLPGIGPQ